MSGFWMRVGTGKEKSHHKAMNKMVTKETNIGLPCMYVCMNTRMLMFITMQFKWSKHTCNFAYNYIFFTYHVIQEKPNGKGILEAIGEFPSQRSVQHQNQPTKCRARHCTPIFGVIVRITFSAGTVTMLPRIYAIHNSPTYST